MVFGARMIGIEITTILVVSSGVAALAHTIQTDADVGATFHIEPNHHPRAGETARAWFAIAHQGGTLIPLDRCHCKLSIYTQSATAKSLILEPPLIAINAEQDRDVPGAEIVFPEAGLYELELSGTPKMTGEFQPFRLTYTVTVSPGTSARSGGSKDREPKESPPSGQRFELPGTAIASGFGLLLSLGCLWRLLGRPKVDE